MTTLYTCEQFAETLAEFLEREVDESTRAAMEAHALTCGDCGPLLADLRKLRIDAANLPELAPSRDLWAGIVARIETPVVELKGGGGIGVGDGHGVERGNRGPRRLSRSWIGLAAAGLVAITATVTHELTKRADAPVATPVASTGIAPHDTASKVAAYVVGPRVPSAPATDTVPASRGSSVPAASGQRREQLVSSRPTAEQTYDAEIKQLRAVLAYRRSQLDSSTIAVVEKNLKIIDDAIAQCRLALQKDPASRFLMESLNDALDTKVQLLRTAVALPSRS